VSDELRHLVPLHDAERELARQMKALQGQGAMPLRRARMSNLVIYCATLEGSIDVNEQLPAIAAVHPTRTILVVGEGSRSECDVSARVTVRPLGLGGRQLACSEQVTLHAGGGAVDRLPFAVRALLIGDLPVNLWWAAPQPPPFAGPLLYELGEHAQQIIYDSVGWPDPLRGVAATARWLEQIERGGGHWRVASDLNWRRLKYWRRLLGQSIAEASAPGAVEAATEIMVEHGPHAVVQAWELASWLAQRLGWKVHGGKVSPGVELAWRADAPAGEARVRIRRLDQGPPEVRKVRVATKLEGKPVGLAFTVEDGQRLALSVEGTDTAARTMALPPHSPAELIGRQLSDRERDAVFVDSMLVAQAMAESVLG
jgi:glucose-6-phosphate dehydrogenase assembly protein OpcA